MEEFICVQKLLFQLVSYLDLLKLDVDADGLFCTSYHLRNSWFGKGIWVGDRCLKWIEDPQGYLKQ